MTATQVPPTAVPSYPRKATYLDALRSEWTKLRTVRATFWCTVISIVLGVGLVALVAAISANHYATDITIRAGWNPVQRSLRPLLLAQLVFAVFGVITVTSEYSTGMIRTSLTAVPRRGRLMATKLAVFTVFTVILAEVIAFASFLIAQMLFHGSAPSASLHQHLALRAVIGAGLYLTLLALLGGAIGFIFRYAAAGIGVIVAIMLVLPLLLNLLPTSWYNPAEEFWPTEAGQRIFYLTTGSHTLTAWWGFGWMALFTAVVIGIAYSLLSQRDA